MHPNRKPLMAGNWKMYKTVEEALSFWTALQSLVSGYYSVTSFPDIVICPPFTALQPLSVHVYEGGKQIALGAQNMAAKPDGAYTGEISARMLTDLNIGYVIIGHSERREYFNETDKTVHEKVLTALENNLTPIVCVGESIMHRDAKSTDVWIQAQVEAALADLTLTEKTKVVLAYEPIWAIGTGQVCEADEANRIIGLIRRWSGSPDSRILYGGSMKPDNVKHLLSQPEIDGGLVGGASLEAESFFKLIQAATREPAAASGSPLS